MSILAVDFGSVHTRAVLIDQVGGAFELVGFARTRTTDVFPANNVRVGLDRVLQQLTEATGRKLTNPDGRVISPELPDRSGVDTFVITASGGRPLRAVVAGLTNDLSLRYALNALSNTYVDVVETLSLQDHDHTTTEQRLNAVLHGYPNVILIAGGTDDGAFTSVMDMVRAVRMAVAVMDKRRRPTVIYAGNALLAQAVAAEFDGIADVLLAPNVRPQPGKQQTGPARALLSEAFNRFAETRGQGFSDLASLTDTGVLPSARSVVPIASYLAKQNAERVIALDVGSAACTLAVATPRSTDFVIRTDLGVGHNAPTLLDAVGADAVKRWLPFEAQAQDIRNYAANKSLRPGIVPYSLREVYLEHGLMKAAVTELARGIGLGEVTAADTVIVGGATLNDVGNPGYTALLAIDALGLTGVTRILADPYGLTAALGAVAATRAEAVAQVLSGAGYAMLGTSICLSGRPRIGKSALHVIVEPEGGETMSFNVDGGHVKVIPLPVGARASVRVRAVGRGLDIDGRGSVKIRVEGGGAGIILDARGRPLPLNVSATQKAALMPMWVAEAAGDEMREIPAEWLGAKAEPKPPRDPDDDGSQSRVRQRQARREERRRRTPQEEEQALEEQPAEQTIEDLRNALS